MTRNSNMWDPILSAAELPFSISGCDGIMALSLAPGRHRLDEAGRLDSGAKHILRPIDNTAPGDAMSPRYTAEKSELW
jgi:hypothetical protein